MATIKVILENDDERDFSAMSSEERAVYFETMIAENPNMLPTRIDDIAEMVEEIINDDVYTIPTIKELLLIKLVQLATLSTQYSTNAVVIPVANVENSKSIKVIFNDRIRYINNGIMSILPAGREINVIQLVLNGHCAAVDDKLIPISKYPHKLHYPRAYIGSTVREIFNSCNLFSRIASNPTIIDVTQDNIEPLLTQILQKNIDKMQYNIDNTRYIIAKLDAAARAQNIAGKFAIPMNKHKIADILTILETVVSGKFVHEAPVGADITWINTASAILYGFANVIYTAKIFGKDSEKVQKLLTAQKIFNAYETKKRQNIQSITESKKLRATYINAIEQKFGSNRARAARTSLNPLAILSKREREIIDLELEKRQKYYDAVANNKCNHVKILRRFRRATIINDIRKLFSEIKSFCGKNDGIIKCKICGFNLICPHVIEITELFVNNKPYIEIKGVLTKYAEGSWCKICGEIISSGLEEVGNITDIEILDEELSSYIFAEVAQTLKYVTIAAIVDMKKIISHIRDNIYPFIFDLDRELTKARVQNVSEVRAKKQLYTTIYSLANIVHLTLSNPKSMTLRNFTARSEKTKIVDIIKFAIDLIMSAKNVIIREIPGMSINLVKEIFVSAYKMVQLGGVDKFSAGRIDDVQSVAELDPVYQNLYKIKLFDAIMGDLPISAIKNIKPKNLYDLPTTIKYRKAWQKNPLQLLCYDAFIARIQLNNVRMFDNISEDDVVLSPKYAEYVGLLNKLSQQNTINDDEKALKYGHMHYVTSRANTMQRKFVTASLNRIYDEKGMLHVWNIYILDDGSERKLDDFITAGGNNFGAIVDKKCAKCGQLLSKTGEIPDEKILQMLQIRRKFGNLFKFYENKCPEGGVHEYSGDKCTKCEFSPTFMRAEVKNEDEPAQKYYKKYVRNLDIVVGAPKSPQYNYVLPTAEIISDFAFDFGLITELSKKIGVNHKLILALGATEKQDYKTISDGTFIPPEIETRSSYRVNIVDGYIKNLFVEYNKLRNYTAILKPPIELAEIISSAGVEQHKLANLRNDLPDIAVGYYEKFITAKKILPPKDIIMFCIHQFCQLCLTIIGTGKLGELFTKYYVARVISLDELNSKPGYFSWSVLYGKIEDTHINGDVEDVAADENVAENDENDPFDTADLDMEDEEDIADSIKVEGYALS